MSAVQLQKRQSENTLELVSSPAIPYILLAGTVALAAVLRLYKLGVWSFWIDEMFTLENSQAALQHLSRLPQLSFILIGLVLRSLPVSEWSARLVPAVLGILTIPILYFPIKKIFGAAVALLSVLLLAISPWHLLWSQNARFYTALLLFYALAMLLFYFALEEDRPWYLLLMFGLLGLAVLERKMAVFLVLVAGAYILLLFRLPFGRPAGLNWRNLVILISPGVILGLYEVYQVALASQAPFYTDFIDTFIGYNQDPIRLLLGTISDVGLPLFVLSLVGGAFLLQKRSRPGLYLLVGVLLPLALVVLISPFTQTFSRYVFQTLPNFAILGAVAVKELYVQAQKHSKILALGVVIVLLADAFSQDVLYYGYQNGNREDWKGAYAIVRQDLAPGDQVVTTRPEIGDYYLQQTLLWSQGLDPRQVIASGQRTWFVIDNRTGFVSPKLQSWLEQETRLVGVRDVYLPGKLLMMRVYLYDPLQPLQPVGSR